MTRERMDKNELVTAANSLLMAFDANKDDILVKNELLTHLEKAGYTLYLKTFRSSCCIEKTLVQTNKRKYCILLEKHENIYKNSVGNEKMCQEIKKSYINQNNTKNASASYKHSADVQNCPKQENLITSAPTKFDMNTKFREFVPTKYHNHLFIGV